MRKIFVLLLFVIATGLAVPAQAAGDEQKLRSLLDEFLAGAGRNDAAVHDRFWAEDLIYTRAAGERTTKAEIMKSVRSAPAPAADAPKTVYTAEEVQVRIYGDTAVVAFKLVGTTTAKDKVTVARFYNTGTFVKRNGRWQAVAWQATAIPEK